LRELRQHLQPTTGTHGEDWKRHRALIDISFASLSLAMLCHDHDAKSVTKLLLSAFELDGDSHNDYRKFLTLMDIEAAAHKMIQSYPHASDELGD